jgi:Tol biopolymer transport system component
MAVVEHGSNQERDLSWLSYSFGPRLSQDGSEVLFTDLSERSGNDYSVYVRKSDGSPAVRLAGGGYGTDISPDGKWALVLFAGDPAARLQIVPVGPGQARMFHWDGIQPQWAQWFPDGHRILLLANQPGGAEAVFVTDADGATPKQLSPGSVPWKAVAPDEKSAMIFQNGARVVRSLVDGTSRPLPGLQAGEFPVAWASDSQHVFVQAKTATGLNIYKLDVESGQRELWQVITPKDAVGLRPMNIPIGITPDGRWMAYNSRTQLGQLYSSDTLK